MSFDSEIINDFSLQRIRHLKRYVTKKQLKRSNLGKINLITILYVTFFVTIAFYFIQSFHLYTFISRFADIAHRLNPKTLK